MPDETVPPPLASCQTFGMGGGQNSRLVEADFSHCQHSRAVVAKQAGKSLHANFMARDPLVSVYCLTATRLPVRFPPHRSVRSLQVLPAWVLPRCAGSFVLYANVWPRGKIAARPWCNPPACPLKQQEVAPAHHLPQHEEDPVIIKTK